MVITHYHSNITQYHMDITWIKSSQVNTLPKAKSKTRSKQNKDMHKCSSVHNERDVLNVYIDINMAVELHHKAAYGGHAISQGFLACE